MNTRIADVLNGTYSNYIMPFFWQHGADADTLREYMGKIHDCGIGAVCLEARPHPDFVGPKWWEDVDVVMGEAKKLGMRVWILDDSHFPSGFACGAVQNAPDDLKRWYLQEKRMEVEGPLAGHRMEVTSNLGYRVFRGRVSPYRREELLAVILGRREEMNGKVFYTDLQDVTQFVNNGWLEMDIPDGNYMVFTYTKMLNVVPKAADHVSFLSKESVKILIDTVYEPHYAHYKADFGGTFAGFFSDEPGFYNLLGNPFLPAPIGTDMPLPWTDEVGEELFSRIGGMEKLPGLYHEIGGEEGNIRFSYMDIVTRCYEENFSRQIGDWCEARGVEYIGHVLEDVGIHSKLGPGTGHYFRAMAGLHMAGIDVVLNQFLPNQDYGHHGFYHYGIQPLAVSAAHQNSRMKGRSMCEIFGAYGWSEGLSMMKWMADQMMVGGINNFVPHAFTERAFPDPDCPPHFYAHGMNPQYRYMSALFPYMNRICHLLSGGRSLADVAVLFPAEGEWGGKYRDYGYIGKLCVTHQAPYELLPCDLLSTVTVKNGMICAGSARYRVLLVDSIEKLPAQVITDLKALKTKGADIRFVNTIPSDYEGNAAVGIPVITDSELEAVVTAGTICSPSEFQKWLRVYPYCQEDAMVYFLVNASANHPLHTQLTVPDAPVYVWYHPEDNTLEDAEFTRDGKLVLNLEKAESVILLGVNEKLVGNYRRNFAGAYQPLSVPFRVSIADYRNMDAFEELAVVDNLTDIHKLKEGFSGIIRYDAVLPGKVQILDLGTAYEAAEVFINGKSAGVRIGYPYRYDISALCNDGENSLRVEVATTLGDAMKDENSLQRPFAPEGVLGPMTILR
ncbi:MAG: glycosyl hydrolase [Faecousia sp.]